MQPTIVHRHTLPAALTEIHGVEDFGWCFCVLPIAWKFVISRPGDLLALAEDYLLGTQERIHVTHTLEQYTGLYKIRAPRRIN